jgi:rod shape-determining protein MreC
VAVFGAGLNRPSAGRGPSPGFRFTLYAILSIVVMFLDQRGGWLEQVRYVLSAAAYPIQLAVNSPSAARRWFQELFETRDTLRAENARLRAQSRQLIIRTQRFEALVRENNQLRGLKTSLPPVADRWLVGEVINVEFNSLRQRLVINRGSRNGVFKGQAVMSEGGLLGQTIHVGPWSAEIILITDPEHAVPVQIERTGVRTIAVGAGDAEYLALPYLPDNADVKPDDLLITSGLGGVFPQGYPVAKVAEVLKEAVPSLGRVRAKPLAHLEREREVMLVWFREGHPAAPAQVATGGTAATGNAAVQPQNAPPRPAAPAQNAQGASSPDTGAPGTNTQGNSAATPMGAQTAGPRGTVPTNAAQGANGGPGRPENNAAGTGAQGTNASQPPNQQQNEPEEEEE